MLDDMNEYFHDFKQAMQSIKRQKEKIEKNMRYCTVIYDKLIGDFHNTMLNISKEYGDYSYV